MKRMFAIFVTMIMLLSCNKVTTQNQIVPIVFRGLKSIDTSSKGTAILIWDQPRGSQTAGFEVYLQDLSASDASKAQSKALKLADEIEGQDVPAILVDLSDAESPFKLGKLVRVIDGGLNTYEMPKLLPGRYAIQIKAVGADGSYDTNKRVAILKVDSTLGYEGISKAEIEGENVAIEWPQLETTLTSRQVVYTIYEGATFANPLAITAALSFKIPTLGYRPGTVLYFGVRSTDAKGHTDRNTKTIAVTVPAADGAYEGCVSGEARGSDRIALKFAWPKETYQTMKILREGVQIFSTSDQGVTDYTDVGLQEGESYKYTCLAVFKDRIITGSNTLTLTTLTSNPPTFKGVTSVDILSPHSAIMRWGVTSGVPTATFLVYISAGSVVDWNADPVAKLTADKLEYTATDLGDDLTYAFGVRACSAKNVCDFNEVQLTGLTGDDGAPKTTGATALAIVNAKLRITAPWTPSQGGIQKRFVYMKDVGVGATHPTFTLVATVPVSDPAHPPTELFVQPIMDNITYTVIVYDQDSHNSRNANIPEISLFSGDTSKPTFGGITSIVQGTGSTLFAETTLRLKFAPIASEAISNTGATDYVAYVGAAGVNACSLTTPYQTYSVANYVVGDANAELVVSGLQSLTTYSVCLKARDAAGNISENIVSFEKSTLDKTAPIFDGIQNVAYDKDKAELALNWNPSTAPDLYEYKIQLWKADPDPSAVSVFTMSVRSNVASVGTRIKQSTFTMNSLDDIYVLVEACDNAGSVSGGTQNCSVHDYTLAKKITLADILPPPNFLGIGPESDLLTPVQGTITVKWVAPAVWDDYRGFKVYFVNQATNELESVARDCPCAADACGEHLDQCDITGLDPYRTYRFHVRAYDNSGNVTILDPAVSSTNKRASDTQDPAFTSNLQLSFLAGATKLTWADATDNQYAAEPGAEIKYEIYRKVDANFSFDPSNKADVGFPSNDTLAALMARVSSLTGHTWTDTGLDFVGGKRYYYTVCAVDNTGNRTCDGNIKNFLCPDLIPPAILTFTTNKTEDSYEWRLNWTASDNVTAGAALQYKIYQKVSDLEIDTATTGDNAVFIATGTLEYLHVRGPQNVDKWIHYLLTVEDADGNKVSKTMSVRSENKVTLTSVRSTEGPLAGGKVIVLVGDGFKPDLTVKVGESDCSGIVRYSRRHIMCRTPASTTAGTANVKVINPDGSLAQLSNAYTYCSGAGCVKICNKASSWTTPFAAGAGTSVDPYMICDVNHLNAIRSTVYGKYYKMGENIDLNGVTFAPLYNSNGNTVEFQGDFDGDNFAISNWIYSDTGTTKPVGFFGLINMSNIRNLGLINFTVTGNNRVGMLSGALGVGQASGNFNTWYNSTSATVSGIFTTGVVLGQSYVGGLFGMGSGRVNDILVLANITGRSEVGGIAGRKADGMNHTEFRGNVTSNAPSGYECRAGGNIGYLYGYSYTLTYLKAYGTVTCLDQGGSKTNHTGGIIGGCDDCNIENAENHATVVGANNTAGIIGWMWNGGTVSDSKNYGNVTGWYRNGGIIGGLTNGNGTITNVWNYGNVVAQDPGANNEGGIIGNMDAGAARQHVIDNANNFGNVSADWQTAGIVGYTGNLTISNSYNAGNVTVTATGEARIGGIVGICSLCTGTNLTNVGNIVAATGTRVGGIYGYANGTVKDSKSSGLIRGSGSVGGLVGQFASKGYVSNSSSSAEVRGGLNSTYGGGLVGFFESGVSSGVPSYIETSSFTGIVALEKTCGGIVGYTSSNVAIRRNKTDATIDCSQKAGGAIGQIGGNNTVVELNSTRGTVTGLLYAGGFVGFAQRDTTNLVDIRDNYSRANVYSNDVAGGFVGSGGGPIFQRCFSTGKVQKVDTESRFGGFAGEYYSTGNPVASFWDMTSSGLSTSTMAVGSTTPAMLGTSLYTGYSAASWSFSSLDYPKLLWEVTP